MIKKVTVSIEPVSNTDGHTEVRIRVLHDDEVRECGKVFRTQHFEPFFDWCLREAAAEIKHEVLSRLKKS